jgi:DNA ligase (NAD+)
MPSAAEIKKNSKQLLTDLPTFGKDELEQLVRYHNAQYWDENDPEIDDPSFDKLVETLRSVEPNSPALDELGESVGGTPERRFETVSHVRPMLSLDKCYDDDTLTKWQSKIKGGFMVTPKMDGLACSIRYKADGSIEVCATRGNGKQGDDITANASQIKDIPTKLKKTKVSGQVLEVRGEVYMRLSRFRKKYASDFANPRNLAAGAIKQKDPKKSGSYGLSFYPYDLLGTDIASEREKNEVMVEMGFPEPDGDIYVPEGGDLAECFRKFDTDRDALDYEIDGVVMKADVVSEHERLGSTAHHPRYAIAYKFQGEGAQTVLQDVEWSVGRTGALTPVAVVDPVFVSGATVTRASLHNWGYLNKLGVKLGCRVEIVRRGGVIPHVERVLSDSGKDVELPGGFGKLEVDGDFVYVDSSHPDILRRRFAHFVKVIDVLGFGEKVINGLIDKGLVKNLADLYDLDEDKLTSLDRMGKKLATKLLAEIDAKKQLPLPVLLTALGIDEVGPTVAESICEEYPTLAKLRKAKSAEFMKLKGIGESIGDSLENGLAHMSDEIDALMDVVKIKKPEAKPDPSAAGAHPLAGKSFVFTGKLASLDRKSAQQKVKDIGGKAPSGVTADLDYLVIGDDGSPLLGSGNKSSKHKKADKLVDGGADLKIISETDFIKMVG